MIGNDRAVELRLGRTLILGGAEVDRLISLLPEGWSDPGYEALLRGEPEDPWDVRTLFDITMRDALDEAVLERSTRSGIGDAGGADHTILEAALDRIWRAWPETDITVGNSDVGPLPSGLEIELEQRGGPDEGAQRVAEHLWAAARWVTHLAALPALSEDTANEVWLDPQAAKAAGEPSGIPDATAEVALANALLILREAFEATYPVRGPGNGEGGGPDSGPPTRRPPDE